MKLTKEQRAVLNDCVIDADAWLSDAIAGGLNAAKKEFSDLSPEEHERIALEKAAQGLAEKVVKRKPEYERRLATGNYKTRKEREIEDLKVQAANDRSHPHLRTHHMRRLSEFDGVDRSAEIAALTRRPS